jgi:hypothetical protein
MLARRGSKMKRTAATIHDNDVLLEVLYRVSTNAAADLFRYAATCKRLCTLVADPSFLCHWWPENAPHPFSLLGFFVHQPDDNTELFIGMDDVDIE